MGASSVTGVGQGSATKAGVKGAEDMFLGVEKLIGTRIVLSGYVVLDTGAATVVLPQVLPGNWNDNFSTFNDVDNPPMDYIIHVNAYNSSSATYVSDIDIDGNDNQTFDITGNGSAVVFWSVVRVTGASVTGYPTHN